MLLVDEDEAELKKYSRNGVIGHVAPTRNIKAFSFSDPWWARLM